MSRSSAARAAATSPALAASRACCCSSASLRASSPPLTAACSAASLERYASDSGDSAWPCKGDGRVSRGERDSRGRLCVALGYVTQQELHAGGMRF